MWNRRAPVNCSRKDASNYAFEQGNSDFDRRCSAARGPIGRTGMKIQTMFGELTS